ncbi:MAG: M14 family metallopeptidase [Oceanicaulis sp.]|nr:M14 family metallopeptidase [Oceanicaulis sp.]
MASCFSSDYRTARNLLLAHTRQAGGWRHECHEHPLEGLDGLPIYIDTFWKGRQDAPRVLVICSGTHGAEGLCGSALQSRFVEQAHHLPDDVAVLLIHGVNPHGFSHLRRVTEDNVDLNRNFIDFSAPLPANEDYRDLNALLNPSELPPGAIEAILEDVQALQRSMEFMRFVKAVSGGQYEFPNGVQFGGAAPAWSRRTIEAIWQAWLGQAGIVVQIDVHSGLGPFGYGALMMAADPDEPHKAVTAGWFRDMLVTPRPVSQADTILGGYLNGALEQQLGAAWVIPMTLEFGTEPPEAVFRAMIEDNWLVHHGDVNSPRGREIKQRLLGAFYPDSQDWRDAVLTRGEQVFSQALGGLAQLQRKGV